MFCCFALVITSSPSLLSFVTTEPAAIRVLSAILRGATKAVSEPTKTFLPIIVRCFLTPS